MHFYRGTSDASDQQLGCFACILKQDDVMRIESQRSSLFVFVKVILRQIYNRKVSVMTNFCKDVYHPIIGAGHQVAHHQKCSFLSNKGAHLRQSIVKFNSGVVIKYFLIFTVTKLDSFGQWANNFLSVFDKFKREYRLPDNGCTGDDTSERMCQSAIHDSNDEYF